MLATVNSAAVIGLQAIPITVEVDIINQGLPKFIIVGLPNKAVDESKERVRSALKNSGYEFPNRRITINLAPGDVPKEGSSYDLAIAIGILIASEQIPPIKEKVLFHGELALDGTIRPINGAVLFAICAKENNYHKLFVPRENIHEASLIKETSSVGVSELKSAISILNGELPFCNDNVEFTPYMQKQNSSFQNDFSVIKGQEVAKRALEIAAAGMHNVLMIGPPGSGKTLLARTFHSILPPLSNDEVIELTKLYSSSGQLTKDQPIITLRPFRSPHHTGSVPSIVGGGTIPKPGEISLSHRGVLFLDEFLEFPKMVLEALRQPLEDGFITVTRTAQSTKFPAKFILLAAANPCPCGYSMNVSDGKQCACTAQQIQKYRKKLSGPILDRIDLQIHVKPVPVTHLDSSTQAETSAEIASRVKAARERQIERFSSLPIKTNGEMNVKEIRKYCTLDNDSQSLMSKAVESFKLSARAYSRILKVARTIADIEGEENINTHHISETLQYRLQDSWG